MPQRLLSSLIVCATAVLLPACASPVNPLVWWKNVNTKAEHLASLEARYEVLESENARLKQDFYKLQHDYDDLQSRTEGEEKVEQNLAETGSKEGRTPASIGYEVPKGLKPADLKALAYEHFREGRFAEASVTFEELLTNPEATAFQDADSMYTAGVSWFKLGNFTKANEHLQAAKATASGEQREKIAKKVDLWMRVMDSKRMPASVKEAPLKLQAKPKAEPKPEDEAKPEAEAKLEAKAEEKGEK